MKFYKYTAIGVILGYHNFQFIATGQDTAYLEEHIIISGVTVRHNEC